MPRTFRPASALLKRVTNLRWTNPYVILRVPENASPDEIKKAYAQLAKITHPDVNGGDSTEFEKISEAYRLLKEGKAREEVDRKLHQDRQQTQDRTFNKTSQGSKTGEGSTSQEDKQKSWQYDANFSRRSQQQKPTQIGRASCRERV